MRIVILAAVAVACTGFASATEVKKDTTKAPVVASKTMTDTDMDKVTAGNGATTVNVNAPNGKSGSPGQGRSPVCFNC